MFGNDSMLAKKIKNDTDTSGASLCFCSSCQQFTPKDADSHSCQKCGSVYGEIDFQLDEKYGDGCKFSSFTQPRWTLQSYSTEVSREYSVKRHVNEVASKIDIPDYIRWNTEAFLKKLFTRNPKMSKSLKSICFACLFFNMRQKDPSFSIKNFCEVINVKPKTMLKYVDQIKPFFFDDVKYFNTTSHRINEGNHETLLYNFVEKLNVKDLLPKEVDLELSLFTLRDEDIKIIKSEPQLEHELSIVSKPSSMQSTAHQKLEATIKEKALKYGVFLINFDRLFPIKFGKNANNFVIGLIIVIFRAFGIPITMKKLCELEDLSLITMSRIAKEITTKIIDEYLTLTEALTTSQTTDTSEPSVQGESEGGKKVKIGEKKARNEELLKKAIKYLYKKYSTKN